MTIFLGIRAAFSQLNKKERRKAVTLLIITFINATLGLVGLASILPFFQLLVAPSPLDPDTMVGAAFKTIGVTSEFLAIVLAGALVVVLIVVKNLFGIFHIRQTGLFCAAVETRLAAELLNGIVEAPFGWYLHQNSSILRDIVMTHVVELARGVIRPALSLANNGLMLLTALLLVIPVTPAPAMVIALIMALIAGSLIRFVRPKIALSSESKRHNNLAAGVAATEAVTGGRDVRTSGAGSLLKAEFKKNYSIYAFSDANSRMWQSIPRAGIEIIGMGSLVVIAVTALFLGMDRIEVASMLALYAVVAVRLIPIIGETANSLSVIEISLPAISHLENLRRELPAMPPTMTAVVPADWETLALRDAHYAYRSDSAGAINGIDLVIERGRSYGIVGSSGAGKSTLADVVAGLLLPTGGSIALDDNSPLNESNLPEWRTHVAYVAQSPLIFDMSVADNIMLGHAGDDSGKRLAHAISAAGLDKVVNALEHNVHTPIGDRGTRLSGGQRQRVAIARAIYQDADVLIMDEATSALDSLTEQEIGEEIEALKGKVTLIAIAHRLSTVMSCDEIILLDKGRILARGSHADLMARSAEYGAFVRAQSMASN